MRNINLFFLILLVFGGCQSKSNLIPFVSHINISHCKKSNIDYLPLNCAFSLLDENRVSKQDLILEFNNGYSMSRYNSKISSYLIIDFGNSIDTINFYSHYNWEMDKGDTSYGTFYLLKSDLQESYQRKKELTEGEYLDILLNKTFIYYKNSTEDEYRIINEKKYRIIKEFTCPLKNDKYEITYQADDCQ